MNRFRLASTITLLEVLVHPLREGDTLLTQKYKDILLASKGLMTYEISHSISEKSALLRAEHELKTPDAIQVATAIHHKADFFLTNDHSLKKVQDLKVLVLNNFLRD